MKKIIFMLLLTSFAQANDLVFKHGFENNVLISGSAAGITASGLVVKLATDGQNIADQSIDILANGNFAFYQLLEPGMSYLVTIQTLPNTPNNQSCVLSNASGITPDTGVANIAIVCNNTPWNWDQMNWDEGGWQ